MEESSYRGKMSVHKIIRANVNGSGTIDPIGRRSSGVHEKVEESER